MPIATHPDLEIIKFVVKVEGKAPVDVQVAGVEKIEFKIPEGSKYVIITHFKVSNNTLKNLKYEQVVKKAGIVLKRREVLLGDYEPSDEEYTKELSEDETPAGFMFRGIFPATSTYFANGEQLMVSDWSLEITKK